MLHSASENLPFIRLSNSVSNNELKIKKVNKMPKN